VHYLKKRITEVEDRKIQAAMVEELREKQQQVLATPSGMEMDEMFRRLKY
jgi:hypothetical protein